MTIEQATADAKRLKQYFPFRIVHIEEESPDCFVAVCSKTKRRMNDALRAGKAVYLVNL